MIRPQLAVRCSLIAVLAAACGSGDSGSRGAAIAVRDSAGITIVEHSAEMVASLADATLGEAELVIGGMDADELHDATFVDRGWLYDGAVVAWHRTSGLLTRYGRDGRLEARTGGHGEGPEEFLGVRFGEAGGDSIFTISVPRRVATIFLNDLSVARTVNYSDRPMATIPFGVTSDGSLLAEYSQFGAPPDSTPGINRRLLPVIRIGAASEAIDTVAMVPAMEFYSGLIHAEKGREARLYPQFGAFPVQSIWNGDLVTAENSDWTLLVTASSGALKRIVRLDTPRRPVTVALRDSTRARALRMVERTKGRMPPEWVAGRPKDIEAMRFADSIAPYDRMVTATDGGLWVRHNELDGDTAFVWFGLERDGHLRWRLTLPSGWRLLSSRGDRVLVLRTDDDGLGYLEVRQMTENR